MLLPCYSAGLLSDSCKHRLLPSSARLFLYQSDAMELMELMHLWGRAAAPEVSYRFADNLGPNVAALSITTTVALFANAAGKPRDTP